ncbi:Hexokinase HKDC1 [Fragariocoptes setiger]|uniref:Phosphotransferase n=1 Tax=Fragariocoptes setiger TaxID=1670756 RepID=A0ABQ7S684_9ACAR|nr:Hexokinase HKDC1 [Fragariocoptes setiger]
MAQYQQIERLTRDLVVNDDQLRQMQELLKQEMELGLSRDTNESATIKMYPTYVRDVPNGTEHGKFLALDLGGTNFRVLLIKLDGRHVHMDGEIYAIPQEIMLGTGQQLFDHIAECLAHFMEKRDVKQYCLPLGFTFSFPCRQEGLTRGRLVRWTKGFRCTGVENQDVVQLLREAIKRRRDIDIDVMAVVNDTTGTLMSCAHRNASCRIGLIVGTGSNACYMESLSAVGTFEPPNGGKRIDPDPEPQQIIINTEWGAFGDNGVLSFLQTKWDYEVDEYSINRGSQLFEKMISGMYMGEIVRRIVVDLTRRGLLFAGHLSNEMIVPYKFGTNYVSIVESDRKGETIQTKWVLQEVFGITNPNDDDVRGVQLICARVSTRAAHLVSAAVATLINRMQRPITTVGVDGSVYRHHPHFHNRMEKKIAQLADPKYKFDLMLSEDGSGRGAALVAAVAHRQQQQKLREAQLAKQLANL